MSVRRKWPTGKPSPSFMSVTTPIRNKPVGAGQFARVKIVFEPVEPGEGYSFESKIVGGNVPREYIPGVEKGLEQAKETGVLVGFPCDRF